MQTRRLVVTGRVQGVFFRDWTIEQARRLGVTGWVRNRRDGSVEILASGEAAALDALASACRSGPPRARVERVQCTEEEPQAFTGFERRPTA